MIYYRFDNEVERGSDNGRHTEVRTTIEEVAGMSRNYRKVKVYY